MKDCVCLCVCFYAQAHEVSLEPHSTFNHITSENKQNMHLFVNANLLICPKVTCFLSHLAMMLLRQDLPPIGICVMNALCENQIVHEMKNVTLFLSHIR